MENKTILKTATILAASFSAMAFSAGAVNALRDPKKAQQGLKVFQHNCQSGIIAASAVGCLAEAGHHVMSTITAKPSP